MKAYRKLEAWETPFDGDIIKVKQEEHDVARAGYHFVKRIRFYRVKDFRNSCLLFKASDFKNRQKWFSMASNSNIIGAYRAI